MSISNPLKKILPSVVGIIVLIVIWQLLSLRPETSLPSPLRVVTETHTLILNPFFYKSDSNKGLFWLILASLKRVTIGYTLAILIGVPIGFLISLIPFLHQAINPIMQLLRPVAPLAWLPLAQAVFLKPNPSAIFVILITAIWPIIISTAMGVQLIPQDYINVGRILQLPWWKKITKIILPATLPHILTGLRIAIGLSWLAVVAAEMLLSDDGLGFFIINAYNNSNISEIILAIIYLGGVGIILDQFMSFISQIWRVEPETN